MPMETPMKQLTVTTLAALMLITFLFSPLPAQAEANLFYEAGFIQPKQTIEAPDFTLYDLNKNKVSLTDYRGKVVLLYFWATW